MWRIDGVETNGNRPCVQLLSSDFTETFSARTGHRKLDLTRLSCCFEFLNDFYTFFCEMFDWWHHSLISGLCANKPSFLSPDWPASYLSSDVFLPWTLYEGKNVPVWRSRSAAAQSWRTFKLWTVVFTQTLLSLLSGSDGHKTVVTMVITTSHWPHL